MKIAHYSTSLSRSAGGLYYSVSGLARATAAQGHEVAVFGGADAHFAGDRAVWGDLDVRSYAAPLGRYGFHPAIIGDIVRYRPDVLHIHGIWSAASVYGRVAALQNLPVVVSPRGMLDPWILARRPRTKTLHAALFERPMLRKAQVHALAESERQSIVRFMPELADRVFVLPNGVPAADRMGGSGSRSGALYLGRLHEKKQVLELMRAWAANPALSGETLTIAGWGERAYEAEVQALAAQTANIAFAGALYHEAKTAALRAAKLFILPSLSEGLPMAVLEALQYGAVPVITDQCNLPELFEDGIALRISSDFTDFDRVLGLAVRWDEATFRARSERAKAYSERYLWSAVAQAMVEQYETIWGARR
ncbi:glycosyltransferase [Pelagibacterium limicola]|uniref:glycosyltransferase n=1 Tax=Pelagibacterium limicola TaxID=2791022 RepID=UPI0018AF6B64|nr:glycosyltransferase [Pelagibacterium limicola]